MTIRSTKMALIAAAAIALTTAAEANATTYIVNRTVGTGSVTGSITTDNTLGNLSTANITGFDLTLNDGTTTFAFNKATGGLLLSGTTLNATSSALSFDYSKAGFALFQFPNPGSGSRYFCFQGANTACADGTGQGGDILAIAGPLLKTNISANQTVANAATPAVPEPAAWAMMILGMAAVGYSMRRSNVKFDAKIKRMTANAA